MQAGTQGRGARAEGAKRLIALVLGAALVLAVVAAAAFGDGLGDPDVPEGAVALVEEAPQEEITQAELDRGIEQAATRQGLQQAPSEGDPQYDLIKDAALSDLLLARWVSGEAEERGITVSEREIDEELERIKSQQFGSERAFNQFLERSGFSQEDARQRVRLQLLSDRIEAEVIDPDQPPEVDESRIEAFYESNKQQFLQPEARDARVILNEDEAQVEQARTILEGDDSAESWERVARRFSADDATRNSGGLRQGLIEGGGDPTLDEQIFSAPEGELVGPFETDAGFYLIQVQQITEESETPLSEAREQIRQQLAGARAQEISAAFQEDFVSKWSARSFCAEDFEVSRCDNGEPPPDPCTEQVAESQGCDAPVASTRPVGPGEAGTFGPSLPQGLPQGPLVGAQPEGPVDILGPGGAPTPTQPGGATPTPPTGPPPGG